MTESFVLALTGGAASVLLARQSLGAIVANIPVSLPADAPARLNVNVLAATLALLVLTALLFGLAPAIRLSCVRVGPALGGSSRQFLIGAEVVLAAAGCLAALIPALRAARVDPTATLRAE